MVLNIVIPTINRADLLYELLISLKQQESEFNELLIIDNGRQNIDKDKCPVNTIIINNPTNFGVAKSWNQGIHHFNKTNYDWLLFLNDDIDIFNNQLINIKDYLQLHNDKYLIIGTYFWSIFAISRTCIQALNNEYFDEQFFPAYFEDNDFCYRICTQHGPNLLLNAIGALEPKVKRNSMTIKKDKTLNNNFDTNKSKYIKKWGGIPGKEKFTKPYNKN